MLEPPQRHSHVRFHGQSRAGAPANTLQEDAGAGAEAAVQTDDAEHLPLA